MFYKFQAHNSETHYGWVESPVTVQMVVAHLNRNREINCYSAEALGDSDTVTPELGADEIPLSQRTDLICTADSSPADFA